MLLASLNGETASRARERIQYLAKAKTVTAAKEGGKGDAGAVYALAADYRLVVGPASSKRWLLEARMKKKRRHANDRQTLPAPQARPTDFVNPQKLS